MKDRLENQKKAYNFLLVKFNSQDTFTRLEFEKSTGWSKSSFDTYWTKQFKTLVIKVDVNKYRVSEAFRRVTDWIKFKAHVTQTRTVSTDYSTLTYDNVILFEFFMPLTNEGHLRTSLDSLFYKDSILTRLKTIDVKTLNKKIPQNEDENKAAYLERICHIISGTFGGYSISHVSGRYRADILKTHKEVYESTEKGNDRYLVDETTAVVKFIFPCGEFKKTKFSPTEHYFDDITAKDDTYEPSEASVIRWLFYVLFVQSIVQVVNGEDEIWMLESGMRNRLHIWQINDGD